MHETTSQPVHVNDDAALLPALVTLAKAAGRDLLAVFSAESRPQDRDAMFAAGRRNEALSLTVLRDGLAALRPAAWLDESLEGAAIPDGEWWVVDAVEGNVNHLHGLDDWAITISLVRNGQTVAAVVHQPLQGITWTAARGAGAQRNGVPIRVSPKSDLGAAIATTGQAEAGQLETHRRIGRSVATMLDHALLVRMDVPSTFPILRLAVGQNDVFWQYSPVLPGVAAGMLLVTEAGGVVSRIDGTPWRPGDADILLAAPGLHTAAVGALRDVDTKELA